MKLLRVFGLLDLPGLTWLIVLPDCSAVDGASRFRAIFLS